MHARLAGLDLEVGKGLAAALEFGEVEFPLAFGELAVEPLFDSVGQILRDCFYRRRSMMGRMRLEMKRAGRLRGAAVVLLEKLAAIGQIAGVDKFHDAPEIEEAVLERRAGEGELVNGAEGLGRLGDHRFGIFDVLRLVEDDGAEGKFLEGGEVAAQERVVGDDEVVLRNHLAQTVAVLAGGEEEDFLAGRELGRLALPVEDDAGRADDEAGDGAFLLAHELEPGERLDGFAKAHVVGEERAELEAGSVGKKTEAGFLVGAQLGDEAFRLGDLGQALEIDDRLAELLDDRFAFAIDEDFQIFPDAPAARRTSATRRPAARPRRPGCRSRRGR